MCALERVAVSEKQRIFEERDGGDVAVAPSVRCDRAAYAVSVVPFESSLSPPSMSIASSSTVGRSRVIMLQFLRICPHRGAGKTTWDIGGHLLSQPTLYSTLGRRAQRPVAVEERARMARASVRSGKKRMRRTRGVRRMWWSGARNPAPRPTEVLRRREFTRSRSCRWSRRCRRHRGRGRARQRSEGQGSSCAVSPP